MKSSTGSCSTCKHSAKTWGEYPCKVCGIFGHKCEYLPKWEQPKKPEYDYFLTINKHNRKYA